MQQLIELITDYYSRKVYGKMTISFEKGKITLIRKEETVKPKPEQE